MHLGDTINFINAIYSLAIQENFYANVYTKNLAAKQLLDIFDYDERIELSKFSLLLKYPFTFSNIFKNDFCVGGWCQKPIGSMTIKPIKINNFILPKNKLGNIYKKDYKCFQLNSFSCGPKKLHFNFVEIKNIIKLFGNENSYYIGRPETKIYLPDVKVHFSNLFEQSKFLLGSQGFFGIDSGMSHLAGSLGVSGDVVIQGNYHAKSVQDWYNHMYPSLRMHYRKILK
jgi:hypothetical protein